MRLTEAATQYGKAGGVSEDSLIQKLADVVQVVERLSDCSGAEASSGAVGNTGDIGKNLLLKSIL